MRARFSARASACRRARFSQASAITFIMFAATWGSTPSRIPLRREAIAAKTASSAAGSSTDLPGSFPASHAMSSGETSPRTLSPPSKEKRPRSAATSPRPSPPRSRARPSMARHIAALPCVMQASANASLVG